MFIILIMGLPGSGKTTLAGKLSKELRAEWINADQVRTFHDDWDFSINGRMRQADRVKKLIDESNAEYIIVDIVAALEQQRSMLSPNFIIWMNTIQYGRYEDTNQAFEIPTLVDIRFDKFDEIDMNTIIKIIQEKHK